MMGMVYVIKLDQSGPVNILALLRIQITSLWKLDHFMNGKDLIFD